MTGRNKRQRLHEGEQTEDRSGVDVRLNDELRGMLGGRKFMKERDLTREILLEYAKRQGAVTVVELLSVTVQTMGGTELKVQLEEGKNEVKWLKLAISPLYLHNSCFSCRRAVIIMLLVRVGDLDRSRSR